MLPDLSVNSAASSRGPVTHLPVAPLRCISTEINRSAEPTPNRTNSLWQWTGAFLLLEGLPSPGEVEEREYP